MPNLVLGPSFLGEPVVELWEGKLLKYIGLLQVISHQGLVFLPCFKVFFLVCQETDQPAELDLVVSFPTI